MALANGSSKALKSFICVDYPGYVKNDQEALKTLGGIDRIEQTFQRRNGKLLLNFNPDNIFSKMLSSASVDSRGAYSSSDHAAAAGKSGATDQAEADLITDHLVDRHEPGRSGDMSYISTDKKDAGLLMPCLLMSVKTKAKNETPQISIVGCIKKVYSFQKIADFQYLPMSSTSKPAETSLSAAGNNRKAKSGEETMVYTAFYDQFRFDNIANYEADLRRNLPQHFLLPPFFSRFDDPVNYSFRSEPLPTASSGKAKSSPTKASGAGERKNPGSQTDDETTSANDENEDNQNESLEKSVSESPSSSLIRSVRQERSSQALLLTFKSDKPVPTKPNEKLKPARSEMVRKCVEDLRELFQKRPCYLKSVLLCVTDYSQAVLKEALPYVAYYFTTGPWRSCWVRYGYDPRLDPEAKIYQMIDYRLRYYSEPDQIVKAKPRSSYHKRKFRNDLSDSDSEDYKNIKIDKEMYRFKPDKLPSSRNVFYQLCDIDDEDVKNLIFSQDSSLKRSVCDEKDGWCIPNLQEKCREKMSQKHETLSRQLAIENKKKH